jgi:hypothetical protein
MAPLALPSTIADYQVLIVGAGLAGLHCALRLSTRFPSLKIAIAEAYGYVGGRVTTYHPKGFPGIQWENGAGRIHSSHRFVRNYLKHYKLHEIPLDKKTVYIGPGHLNGSENTWESFSEIIVKTLGSLPHRTLEMHTVQELLESTIGKEKTNDLLAHFPYRSEVTTLRGDLALASFHKEMGSNADFYCVKEGLSALTDAMRKDLEKRGVVFLLHHRLSSVEPSTTPIACKFVQTEEAKKTHVRITADKVILALHSSALKSIHPFYNLPALRRLQMQPLLRTYGIFPTDKGGPWFKDITKTVTDGPLRFIIPYNTAQGTIMTSYTDGDDTKQWLGLLKEGNHVLESALIQELRKQFPKKQIPAPLYFKAHPWFDGCTYWTPGSYSPQEESEKIMCPQPTKWQTLYVCGESFSMRQAWMEGALEHAEAMLNKYFL